MSTDHRLIKSALAAGLIILQTAGTFSAAAQTSQRITAGKASEYALIYTLPKTVIDITLEAELTEKKPGEFYNYAKRYLGAEGAIIAPSTSASLKSAVISTHGEADPENRWTAQFKSGSTPYMLLSSSGLPLSINTEETGEDSNPVLPVSTKSTPTPLETEAARHAVTQDMARSSSVAKRAELAAQRIFEIRETRSDILSGQAENMPADGKAMQMMLDNLDAQEAALTAMFLGTTSTSTVVKTVSIVPDSTDITNRPIARISAVEGIIDPDNLAGAPVYLSLNIIEEGQLPVNEKGETKRFPKGGVAYNVPGTADAIIRYNGSTVASKQINLAQLGITFGLDPALFTDRKAPSKLIYEPSTGAIRLLGPAETE